MEAALRAIGQTLASLGSKDPRLDNNGKMLYVLQQQLKGYARQDPPATRVKPISITIINHAVIHSISPFDVAVTAISILNIHTLLRIPT